MQARGKVIHPEAFQNLSEEEFMDEGLAEGFVDEPVEEFLAPAEPQAPAPDYGAAMTAGVQRVVGFLYENRTSIRNVALVVGGAYVAVKGPPILAKSFAETAHFLREGWHGRGYEDRWLADVNNKKRE
jgi:hypothetical protein